MCNNNFFGNASNCWIIMLVLLLLLGCGGGCAGCGLGPADPQAGPAR